MILPDLLPCTRLPNSSTSSFSANCKVVTQALTTSTPVAEDFKPERKGLKYWQLGKLALQILFSFALHLPSIPVHPAAMPGFDFSNYNRNAALHAQGVPLPKATSTGTTIVGCIYDGGVVIAADTRATSGPIVADKVYIIPHGLICE